MKFLASLLSRKLAVTAAAATTYYSMSARLPRVQFGVMGRQIGSGPDAIFRVTLDGSAERVETAPTGDTLTGELIWNLTNEQTADDITE